MKRRVLIFLVIFLLCLPIFNNNKGEVLDAGIFLRAVEIGEYRIEIFGFWGERPNVLEKIFSKKDRNFDIVIENQGIKIFRYEELDIMIRQIKGELKSLYMDGGGIRIIKIKDKEK